jgi:O-acetyl-ADP-ribose deacetylase (regulator of RNase III)
MNNCNNFGVDSVIMTEILIGKYIFKLTQGDITLLDVDIIVNAANTSLILGSGVAGAIRRRGGPLIQKECNEYTKKNGSINTGESVITTGGDLKAKYVVHTAGPIYGNYLPEQADQLLTNCVINSLAYIDPNDNNDKNSIAFPAISAGIYGFPNDKCAEIMISTILRYIKNTNLNMGNKDVEKMIIICLYGESMFTLFKKEFEKLTKLI